MTKVSFFSTQVKYSGDFEDYTKEEFLKMAIAKQDKGIDCYEETIEVVSDRIAQELATIIVVDNYYPCNKIAIVKWATIDSQEEEDY